MDNNIKYFSYNQIHNLVQSTTELCVDYKPDVIVAIGGGGYIPARMLRTSLNVPILAVSLELYNDETNTKREQIKIRQWYDLSYASELINDKRVLVVDEVDDTRATLEYTVNEIKKHNNPHSIAVMVVHNKIKEKSGSLSDDILYIAGSHIEDTWICYPWDAYKNGLTIEEHDRFSR